MRELAILVSLNLALHPMSPSKHRTLPRQAWPSAAAAEGNQGRARGLMRWSFGQLLYFQIQNVAWPLPLHTGCTDLLPLHGVPALDWYHWPAKPNKRHYLIKSIPGKPLKMTGRRAEVTLVTGQVRFLGSALLSSPLLASSQYSRPHWS